MAETGVVLVSWHSGDVLRGALAALPADLEVVVIDNAAEEGFAKALQAVRPGVRVIVPGRNLGFGQACNLGAAELGKADILLLNPDARIDAAGLGCLADALGADSRLAAVGPAVQDHSGSWERTWGADPAFVSEWSERRRGRTTPNRPVGVRDVPWLSACCLLVRREAWDAVGGFDPGYFLYYEDADLCRRMREEGWRLRLVPDARAEHIRGVATRALGHRLEWYRRQGQVRYYRRFNGPVDRFLLALRLAVVLLPRCVAGPEQSFWRALLRRLAGAQSPVASADAPPG
ncbi:MAG: glycosyltransferase family 2 protein [Candidatus Sericytochromatia bacterium]|nr:glycosyltransferase family 2 protein [Candidatus Sericytochromatia bacterium]